jgi:hypothetical protein
MDKSKLTLNKEDKIVIKKYLIHYIDKLTLTDYTLSTEFDCCTLGDTEDDKNKYRLGMAFIVAQMQHELSFIKTIGEQQKIDKKWDLIKEIVINN